MYAKAAIGCFLCLTIVTFVVADVSHLAGGNTSPGFRRSSVGNVPVVNNLRARSFNQQNWNIRNNIPGEPGVDYPIYSVPPVSSFSCKGRHYGYYADVESRCQVFRVCATTDLTGKGFAFLCPNGTLFNQKFFVCDWYKNVDCSTSENFFSRNELFGTKMSLMSENDMMSMVQGMVDYTKQPQFNNQNVFNNGGFPFTNSQFPKQLGNTQSLINQNNGLSSFGNSNGQQQSSASNQGRSNVQIPQRGSDILSQPIFPSENARFTTPGQTTGVSGNVASNTPSTSAPPNNQNFNFNSGGAVTGQNNQQQQPTVYVSSLGEISTDPNLRFNPFTTAIVSTRTFDTLSSNVNPVSTSIPYNGQFNQITDNTQSKPNSNGGSFSAAQYQPSDGSNNRLTLQQEINHLGVSASDDKQSAAHGSSAPNTFATTNGQNSGSSDQSSQSLTAVYTGSGDLLSQTINQYGQVGQESSGQNPSLSVLVNSLGETVPVYTGEGNLLSQTIGQRGSTSQPGSPASGSQPSPQTSYYNQQTRVTSAPVASGSTSQQNVPKGEIVYSGEGNLLSQSIGQRTSQPQQAAQSSNSAQNTFSSQGGQTSSRPITSSVTSAVNRPSGGQSQGATSSVRQSGQSLPSTQSFGKTYQQPSTTRSSPNQGTSNGLNSSVRQTTKAIPSSRSFGQTYQQPSTARPGSNQGPAASTASSVRQTARTYQQPSTTNVRTNGAAQISSNGQTKTYNSQTSYSQKSSTGTTAVPYSPSVPPFRSTTTSTYTPTATSYNQHNGQSYKSPTSNQHSNVQSTFANNQFQVPAKEYLPSQDNTRTARTNEFSLGNYGATTKLSPAQNYAGNRANQQDSRQQFTYPVNQKNQQRPIKDHEVASSNQQSYAYPTSYNQQTSQQTYSTYNQRNSYPQYQQQQQQPHPIHYATIDNRPNPSQTTFQAPPLQSHYPASIQNNPQSHSTYHSVSNRYIPSAPSPIPVSLPSIPSSLPSIPSSLPSIPSTLPSIAHSSSQYPTQQARSFPTNQLPQTKSNEKVVVNIIPATGWYLNDANERQSYLDAVSRGLLSEQGVVYVNNVQSSQRQPNSNVQQVQGRSQIDIDEEAYFMGSTSYESPLNSVGKLPGDSDSVSGLFDSTASASSPTTGTGYRYEHPSRSFDV